MRNGMTFSEAGSLGGKASREWQALQKINRIENYNKNPKKCLHCNENLAYEKKNGKFCNKSCAASHNNIGKRRRGKDKNCIFCSKMIKRTCQKFCSLKCQQDYLYKEYIKKWILGIESGGGKWKASHYVRRWMIENYGIKCSICNATSWMGKEIPLVMDHIDGDYRNNKKENLRFVCGNCDMQLPTYKNKNRGNGRFLRRDRYKSGQSY